MTRRLLSTSLKRGIPTIFRGIITGTDFPVSEFLLHEYDLPPADEDYLKIIEKENFIRKFGRGPQLLKVLSPNRASLRRLAIVLPLCIKDNEVIPIPFIVDTGLPEFMCLGSGSVNKLRELEIIKDVNGMHSFCLMGSLSTGEVTVDQPYASSLPIYFEEASIRGDPRLNLLGLIGIQHLRVNIMFTEK